MGKMKNAHSHQKGAAASNDAHPFRLSAVSLSPSMDISDYINFKSDFGDTPLHICCLSEHRDPTILRFLVRHGGNMSEKNQIGETPFGLLQEGACLIK